MKIKSIILTLFITGLLAACKDAAGYRDVIYMAGIESSPSKMVTVDEVPSGIAFSVRASGVVKEPVKVEIQAEPALVGAYNDRYAKNYQPIPEGSYTLSATETTINIDQFMSDPIKLSITDISAFEEGVTYLLPVSIKKVSGGIDLLHEMKTIYFVIQRTIVTQAASLQGNYFNVDFKGKNDESITALPQVTYETRVYVNSFAIFSPFISSLMGIEEHFLLRFGDSSNVDPSQLQATQGDATSSTKFALNKWYHVAAVFDNGIINLYVNGVLENSVPHKSVKVINLHTVHGNDNYFTFGRSYGSRGLNGYISEARVWTKALTAVEIQNNVCYISPDAPNLLAYWRFNGSDGKVVTDLTGHGYDATAAKEITWVPGVKCPE
jgi:hypothetical protein